MQHIFMTGVTGFFGKSLFDYLGRNPAWAAACRFVCLSRDPAAFVARHAGLLERFPARLDWIAGDVRDFAFPSGPFDAIIHAATSTMTTIPDAEQTSVILDGTRRVIEFARQAGCPKILFTSSGAVYGPQTEAVGEDAPCRPAIAYGRAKLDAERMLAESGLEAKIARCFAFVGPHLNRDIHFAIGNFIRDGLAGRPIVIQGDGTPRRSYLHADDLMEWLLAILDRGAANRPYNVGGDRMVSIRELAEIVRRVLGAAGEIVVQGRPDETRPPSVYAPRIERVQHELGLRVKIGLEEAIRKSV